jgi:hypothetical protein
VMGWKWKLFPWKRHSIKTAYPGVFIMLTMPSLVRWEEPANSFPKLNILLYIYIYKRCHSNEVSSVNMLHDVNLLTRTGSI